MENIQNQDGHISKNVVLFCQLLRQLGLKIGPDRSIDALRAVHIAGVDNRQKFYWALASVLLGSKDQIPTYSFAFEIFWAKNVTKINEKNKEFSNEKSNAPFQTILPKPDTDKVTDSARENNNHSKINTTLSPTSIEKLKDKDFDVMAAQELNEAKKIISKLSVLFPDQITRRYKKDKNGQKLDFRSTIKTVVRGNGSLVPLQWRAKQLRPPIVVVLCDISGSMAKYSQMLLHFLHSVARNRQQVNSFLFGTKLTNITRQLKNQNIDYAIREVTKSVKDWEGGTRIGASIKEYNFRWSRRIGPNPVVLLISDGLDRDDGVDLNSAMERLHKSSSTLIWLNPLLRYSEYKAISKGAKQILPHTDLFLPVHNLNSLTELIDILGRGKNNKEQ